MHGYPEQSALSRALPWLSHADAAWTIKTISLYVAGFWPAANPSHAAAEVLCLEEFCALKADGVRDLARLVQVLLEGLRATHPLKRTRNIPRDAERVRAKP